MVYVVMGNDYPEAVFSAEDAAEQFCADRRGEHDASGRIRWSVHRFIIDSIDGEVL